MTRVIGYGICGSGEAQRYMRETLDCFKRLCDEVVILCNNASQEEKDLIDEYGLIRRSDRREWGRFQWKIKQDLLERDISQIAQPGDMLVCLDMDEVLDKNLTREWILEAPLDAYHVFVVDLWNDREHYKPESCFWNVRIWRWNGETKFKQKPVHCGLAPEWTYHYHRHAPFLLLHYGLMKKEDRERKIKRYEKYDPHAEFLERKYYRMLTDDKAKPFNEDQIHDIISKEVATYQQTKPRTMLQNRRKDRFAYVKNPHGEVVDIPERHLKETLARKGFEFIGYADEQQKEMEELFEDVDVDGTEEQEDPLLDGSQGSYQRSTAAQERQFNEMNQKDNTIPEDVPPPVDLPPSDEDIFGDEDIPPKDETIQDTVTIVQDTTSETIPPLRVADSPKPKTKNQTDKGQNPNKKK